MSETKRLRCHKLLTQAGWADNATVVLDEKGTITAVETSPQTAPNQNGTTEAIDGFVIPGFCNGHSHAFQYAMAGLGEHLPAGHAEDDFWSWRETMYQLALTISPEEVEAVASMLYAEMLRFGITGVAEFHYLHHDGNGAAYDNRAEMAERLAAAAQKSGIQLTLVPVFYQKGGFGTDAKPTQRRFLCRNLDDYHRLLEASAKAVTGLPDGVLGSGIHSLRAVEPDLVPEALASRPTGPVHLHISEQAREVQQAAAHLGSFPVHWLADHVELSSRFHLVHATHMSVSEAKRLAETDATVVVCPSTEGNLGDGFFPLADYRAHGGEVAIGTDSHIGLSPQEELRWFDYGQRLGREKRNVICRSGGDDSGRLLFLETWRRGRKALGVDGDTPFSPGQAFDAVVLDPTHPVLCQKPDARILSAFVYGADATAIKSVYRRGAAVVQNGRHLDEGLGSAYAAAMKSLVTRLP